MFELIEKTLLAGIGRGRRSHVSRNDGNAYGAGRAAGSQVSLSKEVIR